MPRISGGAFLIGSLENTPNSEANERPSRRVTLSGFYMSRFQVTQGEWFDMMFHLPGGMELELGAPAFSTGLTIESAELQRRRSTGEACPWKG